VLTLLPGLVSQALRAGVADRVKHLRNHNGCRLGQDAGRRISAGDIKARSCCESARSIIQPCSSHSRMAPASSRTEVAQPSASGSLGVSVQPSTSNSSRRITRALPVPPVLTQAEDSGAEWPYIFHAFHQEHRAAAAGCDGQCCQVSSSGVNGSLGSSIPSEMSSVVLQSGHGAPAAPQGQARGPCHGRSGWFSQTQPQSSQREHVMRTDPRQLE
jgi:hypothetical protein